MGALGHPELDKLAAKVSAGSICEKFLSYLACTWHVWASHFGQLLHVLQKQPACRDVSGGAGQEEAQAEAASAGQPGAGGPKAITCSRL